MKSDENAGNIIMILSVDSAQESGTAQQVGRGTVLRVGQRSRAGQDRALRTENRQHYTEAAHLYTQNSCST